MITAMILCGHLQGAAAGLPVRKAEVTDECPPSDGAAARGDPRRPGSAFSEATQQTGAQHAQTAAKQLKVRVGPEAPEAEEEESMSRAHSTAEALAAKGVCPCPSLVSRGELLALWLSNNLTICSYLLSFVIKLTKLIVLSSS